MSPNQLQRLLTRCDSDPPHVFGDEVARHFADVWPTLRRWDWVRPCGHAGHVLCPSCQGVTIRVEWVEMAEPLPARSQGWCRDCGVIVLPDGWATCWALQLETIVRHVCQTSGMVGECTRVVPDALWRLGLMYLRQRQTKQAFFAVNRVAAQTAVLAELAKYPDSLLWVPSDRSHYLLQSKPQAVVLRFSEFLNVEQDELTFHTDLFAGVWQSITATSSTVHTAPTKTAKAWTKKTRNKCLKEIRQLLQAAHAHLVTTGHLLPRPKQKLLADLVGVSRSTMSRILADQNEQEIGLIWRALLDIDAVRRYRHKK